MALSFSITGFKKTDSGESWILEESKKGSDAVSESFDGSFNFNSIRIVSPGIVSIVPFDGEAEVIPYLINDLYLNGLK
jgi:hypothetical protein